MKNILNVVITLKIALEIYYKSETITVKFKNQKIFWMVSKNSQASFESNPFGHSISNFESEANRQIPKHHKPYNQILRISWFVNTESLYNDLHIPYVNEVISGTAGKVRD